MAGLRDLPMALAEETARAVLALVVGIVGLPLLLLSQALALNDAVAGYVNGIIAGVFGYCFSTRSTAADAQTARRAQEALATEQPRSAELRKAAEAPDRLGETLATLEAQARAARQVLGRLGPGLPRGLLPEGASAALSRAEALLRLGRGANPAALAEALVRPDRRSRSLPRAAARRRCPP